MKKNNMEELYLLKKDRISSEKVQSEMGNSEKNSSIESIDQKSL